MKVLSPEVKGHERAAEDPFGGRTTRDTDIVRRLQLGVCPDSSEHETRVARIAIL